jgi:hypothetical protein
MVYEDHLLSKRLGKSGRKIAEKHNWEYITTKLEDLLLKTVSV